MSEGILSVRQLRRTWKPHKERLSGKNAEHPTNVRFHRACSWLQLAEELTETDLDLALLGQWVAFNALYGQWDHGAREPVADVPCWKHFLERMASLDEGKHIVDALVQNKPLVMAVLEDHHLSRHFWQEPSEKRAGQSRKTWFDARTWYVMDNWAPLLDRVFERIYFLRCQLVHGAASHNSSLNRKAIQNCTQLMDQLLRVFLRVWAEYGADEDWGILCYPPTIARKG